MSDQVWWYATRAAGLMTWSTAVASVIVGLLLSTRAVKSRTGPWMLDLHRFLGGISVLFLVVHVGTLYLDSFVEFGPRELFVPGESTWNTEAAAWGIIAMYALVLVELTSLLRKHLSQSVWRTFHMLSVVTAVAGTYHAILGGSDVDNPLTWVVAGAGSAIVIALVALRLKGADEPTSPRAAKANDREALLQEMRDRLETLPISADVPQAELTTDGASLPRREPAAAATTTVTVPAGPAAGAFGRPIEPAAAPTPADEPGKPAAKPFTAAPTPAPGYDQIADTGHRIADPFGRGHAPAPAPASTPPADPFSPAPADPFATQPAADPFVVAPQPDPAPAADTPIAPAAAPFLDPTDLAAEQPPTNPFGGPPPIPDPAPVFGTEPPTPTPPADPFAAPAPADDLFAPATPTEVAAEARAVEPFPELDQPPPAHATPPAQPATEPFAAAPAPAAADPFATSAPAPAPTPAATGTAPPPPPLPTAVDPITGEPDQAAYTAWLVEWLAYAEKYGEETPEDPSRML